MKLWDSAFFNECSINFTKVLNPKNGEFLKMTWKWEQRFRLCSFFIGSCETSFCSYWKMQKFESVSNMITICFSISNGKEIPINKSAQILMMLETTLLRNICSFRNCFLLLNWYENATSWGTLFSHILLAKILTMRGWMKKKLAQANIDQARIERQSPSTWNHICISCTEW